MRARVRKDTNALALTKAPSWSVRVASTLPRGARVSNPLFGEHAAGTIAVFDPIADRTASLIDILKHAQDADGALIVLDEVGPKIAALLHACGYTIFKVDSPGSPSFAANYSLPDVPWLSTSRPPAAVAEESTVPRASLLTQTAVIKDDGEGAEERFVLGVVLEPDEVDSQGDTLDAETIRQAAHGYMQDYGNVGLQHQTFVNGKIKILESYIAPVDFEVGGQIVKAGTWLMAFRVLDDAIWKAVKEGLLTGLSIGGFGNRVPA